MCKFQSGRSILKQSSIVNYIGHFNYTAVLSLRHQSTSPCHRSLKTRVARGNAKHAGHMVQLEAKSAAIQHTKTIPQVFFFFSFFFLWRGKRL